MKQITSLSELEGKTIAKVYEDYEALWLGFSDNTFTIIGLSRGYYDEASLKLLTEDPDLLGSTQAVLKIGLATVEELQALEREKQRKSRAEAEKREREQYARLAAKFGKSR